MRLTRWIPVLAAVAAVAGAVATWRLRHRPAPEGSRPTPVLAVLPFVNEGGDPDGAYMAEGLTADLIDALSRVPGLTVIARTSAFTFQGRTADVRAAGRRLGADRAIAGSVQRVGKHWRATAQLAGVRDSHVRPRFETHPGDAAAVREELISAIASGLNAAVPPQRSLQGRAYDLYLRARYAMRQTNSPAARARASSAIQALLREAPEAAPAHALLADYHYACGESGGTDYRTACALSRQAAERAVELDPDLAAAHARLGAIYMGLDHDLVSAGREYRRAVELDPGSSTSRSRLGLVLLLRGRTEEGLSAIRHVLERDPVSGAANNDLVFALFLARRYGEAREQADRTIALNTSAMVSYLRRAWVHAAAGHFDAALRDADVLEQLRAGALLVLPLRGYVYARQGRQAEARAAASAIERAGAANAHYALALVAAGTGDSTATLQHLEAALASGDPYLLYTTLEPQFDPVRNDARYPLFLKKLELKK